MEIFLEKIPMEVREIFLSLTLRDWIFFSEQIVNYLLDVPG